MELLREDTKLLTSEDKLRFETLVASLDAKYSQRFYSILEEAKVQNMTCFNRLMQEARIWFNVAMTMGDLVLINC